MDHEVIVDVAIIRIEELRNRMRGAVQASFAVTAEGQRLVNADAVASWQSQLKELAEPLMVLRSDLSKRD